jgi:hypothetical protein
MALVRLALAVAIFAGLWMFGRLLSKWRGPRPEKVVRYEPDLMGAAAIALTFAVAFSFARVLHLKGWEGNGPIGLAAFMAAGATLLTFRFAIVVGTSDVAVKYVLRPGWRRVDWSAIRSWRAGRKAGTIVFQRDPSGSPEPGSAFKEGFDVLLDAVDARGIPEAK